MTDFNSDKIVLTRERTDSAQHRIISLSHSGFYLASRLLESGAIRQVPVLTPSNCNEDSEFIEYAPCAIEWDEYRQLLFYHDHRDWDTRIWVVNEGVQLPFSEPFVEASHVFITYTELGYLYKAADFAQRHPMPPKFQTPPPVPGRPQPYFITSEKAPLEDPFYNHLPELITRVFSNVPKIKDPSDWRKERLQRLRITVLVGGVLKKLSLEEILEQKYDPSTLALRGLTIDELLILDGSHPNAYFSQSAWYQPNSETAANLESSDTAEQRAAISTMLQCIMDNRTHYDTERTDHGHDDIFLGIRFSCSPGKRESAPIHNDLVHQQAWLALKKAATKVYTPTPISMKLKGQPTETLYHHEIVVSNFSPSHEPWQEFITTMLEPVYTHYAKKLKTPQFHNLRRARYARLELRYGEYQATGTGSKGGPSAHWQPNDIKSYYFSLVICPVQETS